MNQQIIAVQSCEFKQVPKYITSFSFEVRTFQPYSIISFNVYLYTASRELIDVKFVELKGNAYDEWGLDDGYLVSYISEQLGLIPISPVVLEPLGPLLPPLAFEPLPLPLPLPIEEPAPTPVEDPVPVPVEDPVPVPVEEPTPV